MDGTETPGRRGPVEWLDDLSTLMARTLAAWPRLSLAVCALLTFTLASGRSLAASQELSGITLQVTLGLLCGALYRVMRGAGLRLEPWVLPAAAVALHLVHEGSTSPMEENPPLSLAALAGVLLAFCGAASGRRLPTRLLITLIAAGCAARIVAGLERGWLVLPNDIDTGPALWALGVAALALTAQRRPWLLVWGVPALIAGVAGLGGEQAVIDVETAILLLGAVAAARVTDRLTNGVVPAAADASAARVAQGAVARPLVFTVAILVAAMVLEGLTRQVTRHIEAWSWIAQADGLDWWSTGWILEFVSRPEPWYAAIALIAHGPMRRATNTVRMQCILLALAMPFVVLCVSTVPLLFSTAIADSWEAFASLFGAHWLLFAAVPASGLLLRRRHRILSPLDYTLIAATVALAPVGLLLRSDPTGFEQVPGVPWGQAPWAAAYITPLVPVLLLHRLVASGLRMRTIVAGACVAALFAAGLSLVVIALLDDHSPGLHAMDAFTTLEITIDWLASAACIAFARVLSRPDHGVPAADLPPVNAEQLASPRAPADAPEHRAGESS